VSAAARLAELRGRHGLAAAQRDRLDVLLELLSAPRAPTAVHEPERAVDVHIADSLSALELEPVRAASCIADLGSGAGLPGLPLAIALPHARVALVESVRRKARLLGEAIDRLGLTNAAVVAARAEGWPAGLGAHDLVVARALAAPEVVLEYGAPLLGLGGWLVAWRAGERTEPDGVAELLGLSLQERRRSRPYALARDLRLDVYRKVAPTPERFPRRPGVARRSPLRAAGA
jgi:16S rRNA (guanine527-N7)-methyltransferase